MRIVASPARRNRNANPFNFLLSEALAGERCDVFELDRRNFLLERFDIFHIHWPQREAQGPLPRALRRSALLILRLAVQRLKGARIVWTVHNVNAHDRKNLILERMLMQAVAKLVHGVIFMTASSRDAACSESPQLARLPFAIIPHGVYGQRSKKSRAEARSAFGISPTAKVVGFLGDIRSYKGLDLLLDAFETVRPGQITLFVAGAFVENIYGDAIRPRLARLATRGHSIVFREDRLDDGTLVDAIRASDAVALPYRATWNSGLAVLVLENGGRIITSDAPLFRELRNELGSAWVHIAEEALTSDALIAASDNVPATNSPQIVAFCAARSWSRVARETIAFYRRLRAVEDEISGTRATEMPS